MIKMSLEIHLQGMEAIVMQRPLQRPSQGLRGATTTYQVVFASAVNTVCLGQVQKRATLQHPLFCRELSRGPAELRVHIVKCRLQFS